MGRGEFSSRTTCPLPMTMGVMRISNRIAIARMTGWGGLPLKLQGEKVPAGLGGWDAGGGGPAQGEAAGCAGGQQGEGFGFDGIAAPASLFGSEDGAGELAGERGHEGGVMAPAAAGDEAGGNLRELTDAGGDGGGGKFRQGRGAILQREAARHRGVEIIPVERFWRGLIKPVMGEELGEQALMHAAGGGELSACVMGAFSVAFDPFVDGAVGGAGVEGDQRAIGRARGDVGDAAEIEEGGRLPAEAVHQRGVVGRGEWRALPAGGDIGAAEIKGERHAEGGLHCGRVDQLKGGALLACLRAAVEDGLAMDARQDGFGRARLPGHHGPGVGMGSGDGFAGSPEEPLGAGALPVPRAGGVCGGLKDGALLRGVFALGDGAECQHLLPVCEDHGGIDGVQRGAGHEACDPLRGGFFNSGVQGWPFPC